MRPDQRIPLEVRKHARVIMRHVRSRHRRTDLSRISISMRLERRAADLAAPVKAKKRRGKVGWWVNLSA